MKESRLSRIKKLFLIFFKIGAFTFGGGYAMIPFIEKEIVEETGWIESEDIVDIFAVVQSVPGVIAVNSATFVGYRVAGFLGALAATLGVVLPSFIIISIIALFLYNFRDYPLVKEAIKGINIGVVALMISAVVRLGKKSVKNPFSWIICILSFFALVLLDISPITVLLVSAIAGLAYCFIKSRRTLDTARKEGKK